MSEDFHNDIRLLMEQLDRSLPPGTNAVLGRGDDPLVEAARQLALGPEVRLSDAALDRIEARLRQRTAAIHRPVARPIQRPVARRSWVPVLRYAAAALLVVILAMTGVTGASASSVPGDELYPVKRAVEDVRLALAPAGSEPGLHADFAERRLDEFQTLLDRREFYPRALEEASDEMDRALDLLAGGHGDRTEVDPQLATLAHRQAQLVERAVPLASASRSHERLAQIADDNQAIQARLAAEGTVPDFDPDDPLAEPTVTPTPTPTPTRTPKPTPTISRTPVPLHTPVPGSLGARGSVRGPTRTPPGHGPTPGLGGISPGQGGANPGIGQGGDPQGGGKDKGK